MFADYIFPSAFLAGLLTVLAPCTLTLLPVMLGGSVGGSKWRPLVISLSLGASVMIFTLLLKMSGAFLDLDGDGLVDIPEGGIRWIAGGIVTLFAITMAFPKVWDWVTVKLGIHTGGQKLIEKSQEKEGIWGAVLLGLALGPVFNSCSPTYLLILASILPQDLTVGFYNLLSYTAGLVAFLLVIGYGGRAVVNKVKFAANPEGKFRRGLGFLLLIVGVAIIFSLDKTLEAWIITTVDGAGFGEVFNLECLAIDCDRNQMLFAE